MSKKHHKKHEHEEVKQPQNNEEINVEELKKQNEELQKKT
jgi:hypothetical protein